jgi:hypothetical protein
MTLAPCLAYYMEGCQGTCCEQRPSSVLPNPQQIAIRHGNGGKPSQLTAILRLSVSGRSPYDGFAAYAGNRVIDSGQR